MVLAYFGRHVSARELSTHPVNKRDGVTAQWLVTCAQQQGLHAAGFQVSADELKVLPTPAILHTTASHFVVFEGLSHGRVAIVDPSVGRRELGLNETRDLLSGTAIAFELTTEFQPRSRARLTAQTLSPVLVLDRLAVTLLSIVGVALTSLILASGTDQFWSAVLGGPHRRLPANAVLTRTAVVASLEILIVIALLRIIDACVRSQVSAHISDLVAQRRRAEHAVHERGSRVPEEVLTSYIRDIGPLTHSASSNVSGLILIASALLGAALASWSMCASVPILLAAFAAALITSVLAADLTSRLADHGPEGDRYHVPWRQSRVALGVHVVRCAHVAAYTAIWLCALHFVVSRTAHHNQLSLLGGVYTVCPQLLLAIATFRTGDIIRRGRRWLATYELLEGALPDQPSPGDSESSGNGRQPDLPSFTSCVPLLRLRRVTLQLGDARDRLLSELSVDLNESEHVAFVGPRGIGKTTLVRAIRGELRSLPGTILYCGHPLSKYRLSDRARMVRGIAQGDRLADGSIAGILRLSRRDASPTQLRTVCALLDFDKDVSNLPLQYETPVTNDGDTLSRAQRQMVMLAQAVMSEARVLALDDPVNSLDEVSARRVLEALSTLPTTVVLTMSNASALHGLNFRVVNLRGLGPGI